jgi:SAM-dependent methyltransferase
LNVKNLVFSAGTLGSPFAAKLYRGTNSRETASSDNAYHQDRCPADDGWAANYDRLARDYRWFGPEVLFGLCFEYVQPGNRLLSIGIGTGLCAFPFAKAGLQVFGLDISLEMLNVCRSKGIAVELQHLDIRATPWPYLDGYFDHVIACGVLHFLDDLVPIFQETARVVRAGGLFAFTTKAPLPERQPEAPSHKYSTEVISGVTVFSHRKAYLDELMTSCGFGTLKDLELWVGVDQTERCDPFSVFVTYKTNIRTNSHVAAKD